MKLSLATAATMSPERRRALDRLEAKGVKWHVAGEALNVALDAHEEVEHLRPVVDIAKALVDAKSGEARARAIELLFPAIAKLRKHEQAATKAGRS